MEDRLALLGEAPLRSRPGAAAVPPPVPPSASGTVAAPPQLSSGVSVSDKTRLLEALQVRVGAWI